MMNLADRHLPCLIVGAGGHARTIADTLRALDSERDIVMLDPEFPELRTSGGFSVIGIPTDLEKYRNQFHIAYAGLGDARKRLAILESLQAHGYDLPTLGHPMSWISPQAVLGPGTVVMAGAIVQIGATLGRGCIINTGASVDHDCQLGDGVHVAPGARLSGAVAIGDQTWIGVGAVVKEGVKIGSNVTVGAGAAVVHDINNGETVIGIPARPMKT